MILHEDVALLDVDAAAIDPPRLRRSGGRHHRGDRRGGVTGLAWWGGPASDAPAGPLPGGESVGVAPAAPSTRSTASCCASARGPCARCASTRASRPTSTATTSSSASRPRHHGRRVEVIELDVHTSTAPLFADTDRWVRNELRFRQRWLDHRLVTRASARALSEPRRRPTARRVAPGARGRASAARSRPSAAYGRSSARRLDARASCRRGPGDRLDRACASFVSAARERVGAKRRAAARPVPGPRLRRPRPARAGRPR